MNQKRVLFVDDDAALREVVKNQLTAAGYLLDEAADGMEAMTKLKEGDYNLMLLDINMPGKSGIDVLKFIRENSLHCRVIMLTGRVGFSIATESLKLGADEYITKPFSLEYLLDSIQRVLAK
jgi:DNA-binding response OmpR family regulator